MADQHEDKGGNPIPLSKMPPVAGTSTARTGPRDTRTIDEWRGWYFKSISAYSLCLLLHVLMFTYI